MFKKLFSLTLLLGTLGFITGTVHAQVSFYNGSGCTIQVKAAVENPNNPCSQPSCITSAVTIAPYTSATLYVDRTCFMAGIAYRAVKVYGLVEVSADKCRGPNPAAFTDCQRIPRVLHILSANYAAIY